MEPSPINTQALPAGTRIEEFVIERVLGSGGFGITYLARDTSLNRQVVIKENLPAQFAWRDPNSGTVRPRHTSGGDEDDFEWSLNNFLREAETLASLDHTGIVRVLRKFETNGTAYFVMPFVEGVAFDTLIEERKKEGGCFTEDELRGLLDRMLQALGYLHDRGIYHRDIKPGNLLISNEGVPALIDFGSARQRLSERSMTVVESAGYTPFEQLQSRGNVGPWSDLFALAATLVKAITFEAPPKAADRIGDDPMVPLALRENLAGMYSAEFLASIDRALAVNVKERWQNAEAWRAGLIAPAAPKHAPPRQASQTPSRAFVDPVDEFERQSQRAAIAQSAAWDEDDAVRLPTQPGSDPEQSTIPALWNPTSAVNLSVLFTPAFGAFLHARNARAMGNSSLEKWNMRFFYGMLIATILSLFLVNYRSGLAFTNLILIAWYYALGKQQVRVVKSRFGTGYPKKSFAKPLLVGFGCLFVAVMCVKGVHSTLKDAPSVAAEESAEVNFQQGQRYYEGQGVAKDYTEAVKWFLKAANQGYSQAQGMLGVCYANGQGVTKDSLQAAQWYRKAANQGVAQAQWNLGRCYDNGEGVAKDAAQAVQWYRKAADQDHPLAQGMLGVCYQYGLGVAKDPADAVRWYRKSANQGNANAQNNLGDCYAGGAGVAKDPTEAVQWYQKSAAQGNAPAMNSLGTHYENGVGIAKNEAKAVEWYRKAADAGDADGMTSLGVCLLNGTSVSKDEREAVKWWRKGAAVGNARSMRILGLCYANGNGVEKDQSKAVEWYRKAADAGDAYSMASLGVRYEYGTGVAKDVLGAMTWYHKGAEAGSKLAMRFLANNYTNGIGVEKDQAKAVEWYRKAADAGDADSMTSLGVCYKYGTAVTKDEVEAVRWFRKGFEAGDVRAMRLLGISYAYGTGVAKDQVKASEWYRKAADAGDAYSMTSLGLCYELGTAVMKDAVEAVKWYRKGAEGGDVRGMSYLGINYSSGIGVEKDQAKAVEWYRRAADEGDSLAQNNLGDCYANGQGIDKDPAAAVKWYQKSADQGNSTAQVSLGLCLYNGDGVSKDLSAAAGYWRKAADQGAASGQCNLGVCYANGEGVAKDPTEAVKWYRKAAEQGHEQAKKNLEAATRHASSSPVAETKHSRPGAANITEKLSRIIIPRIDIDDCTVEEVVDFLRLRAAELDTLEPDPANKGANFVVRRSSTTGAVAPRVGSLHIRNVPLAVALKYVCEQIGYRYRIDDFSVTLEPIHP